LTAMFVAEAFGQSMGFNGPLTSLAPLGEASLSVAVLIRSSLATVRIDNSFSMFCFTFARSFGSLDEANLAPLRAQSKKNVTSGNTLTGCS